MNDNFQVAVLALIQGLTEFLPISSSAHLLLPSQLLGWPDQGMAFDVAVHIGSLVAVISYFRKELITMTLGWLCNVCGRGRSADSDMAWLLIVATIPAGLAGLIFGEFVEAELRSAEVIAFSTLSFGLLLGAADYYSRRVMQNKKAGLVIALAVGFAQMLAIIPGTSRSGITMTAALFCGLNRQAAARFSFLMSIPIIAAAGFLKSIELSSGSADVDWLLLFSAGGISACAAYICIGVFVGLIDRVGFLPFVIYRLLLSFIIFYIV